MNRENEMSVIWAFEKSPRMLMIQQQYPDLGSSIGEIVHNAYQIYGSIDQAAKALSISSPTFCRWTHLFSVPVPRADPELVARRTQSLRATYATRGAEIVAKIHAGDSDERRGKTLASIWIRTSPEVRLQIRKKQKDTKRKKLEEALKFKLQGDPIEIIRDMHFKQRFSLEEIGRQTVLAPETIKRYAGSEIKFKCFGKTGSRKNFAEHQEIARKAQQSSLLKLLPERTRTIIEGRFLRDGQPLSLVELGEQFGVTGEAIRLREFNTLKILQQVLLGEKSPDVLRVTRSRERPLKAERFPDYDLNTQRRPAGWREFDILGLSPQTENSLYRSGFNNLKVLWEMLVRGDEIQGLNEQGRDELKTKLSEYRNMLLAV